MDDTPDSDSDSNLAWFWVIEALASFKEVEPSIFWEIVETAPKFDLGKNTKEMVALRCLEEIFGPNDGNTNNVSSSPGSKIRLELSESCEDVLHQIFQQTSTGPELSKWDIQPFIQHKSSCMPECALKQLKHAILDGSHPYADFLGKKSGLPLKKGVDRTSVEDSSSISLNFKLNQSCIDEQNLIVEANSNPPIIENRNEKLENLHYGDTLLSKRDRSNFVTDDMATHENQDNINDSGDQPINSKRMKLCASSASQLIEKTSVPLHERDLLEDSTVRVVTVTEKEGCDLAENQVGNVEEGRVLEDGRNDYTISKICDHYDGYDAFHNSQSEISSNNVMMPQHNCGDETQSNLAAGEGEHNLSVDEAKGASEHCAEPTSGSPSDGSLYKISFKEEHNFSIQVPNPASPNVSQQNVNTSEVEDDMDLCFEAEILNDNDGYQDEGIDVTKKKHDFLSCRYTVGQNSSEIADWTEKSFCVKCNEGGELLVCKLSGCPLVIHENCLGSSAKLDDRDDFYCPFCAYSHASREYLGAKKKASLVKKELTAFIRTGLEQRSVEFIEKLSEKENYCVRGNGDEVFLDKIHENEHLGQREENQRNQYELCISGMPRVPAGEEKGKEKVEECSTARGHEEKPDQVLENSGNVLCENSDMIVEHQEQDEIEIQQEVLKEHITNALEEPVHETNTDGEEISEGDESIISNYHVRVPRGGKQFAYPENA